MFLLIFHLLSLFPHLQSGDNNSRELLGGLNEVIHVKLIEEKWLSIVNVQQILATDIAISFDC